MKINFFIGGRDEKISSHAFDYGAGGSGAHGRREAGRGKV
jgi:hypothetical protein